MKISFLAKNKIFDIIGFICFKICPANKTYLVLKSIFFLFNIFNDFPILAQIQWANAIRECSQENNFGNFSPQKALGQPNVSPNNEVNAEAWTIDFSKNQQNFTIEVSFEKPIRVQKIFIAENMGIGLKTVLLKDDKGQEQKTYTINENYNFSLEFNAKISHIILYKPTDYLVKTIKLVISAPFIGNIAQLDGIGIAALNIPFEYEKHGNRLVLPTNAPQQIFIRQDSKIDKSTASNKHITNYFKNREVSKYVLKGYFSNGSVKINKEMKLQLINLQTNDSLNLITEADGSFQIGLDEAEYSLAGFQKGYLATKNNYFSTVGKQINEVININVPIQTFNIGENYVFSYLNFDLNSDSIDIKSVSILEQIYITLRENDKTLVRIEVHTDARGDDNHNLMLTKKRAEIIRSYLQQKGIPENRLIMIGLGELELRNKCGNGVRCDNGSHSMNRRIEIEILDYLD